MMIDYGTLKRMAEELEEVEKKCGEDRLCVDEGRIKVFKKHNLYGRAGVLRLKEYMQKSGYQYAMYRDLLFKPLLWGGDEGYIMEVTYYHLGRWIKGYVFYKENIGDIRKRLKSAGAYLSEHYGVKTPALHFKTAELDSCYNYKNKEITIGVAGLYALKEEGALKVHCESARLIFKDELIINKEDLKRCRPDVANVGIKIDLRDMPLIIYAHEFTHHLGYREHGEDFAEKMREVLVVLSDYFENLTQYIKEDPSHVGATHSE